MTAPDPRLGEIAVRINGLISSLAWPETPEERDEADTELTRNVAYLLAALADRDAKLARVEALAGKYDYEAERLAAKAENFIQGEVRSRYLGYAAETRMQAYLIRAAVADTTGGEDK